MNKVSSVKPLQDGKVFVEMTDGRTGAFDVKPYMRSAFFRELTNDSYFHQVQLIFGGIGWPNGQDIGPDTISAELIETEFTH